MRYYAAQQPQLVRPLLLGIYRLAKIAQPSPVTTRQNTAPFTRCALRVLSSHDGRLHRLQPGYDEIKHAYDLISLTNYYRLQYQNKL
jgi:hypothetical protein